MNLSHMMLRSEQQTPADAQLISHQLLLKSGLIRQLSSGIYSMTPMALRVLQRIIRIAQEEMNHIGGQELLLPVVQPASLWRETGRYSSIDESLVRFQDRGRQDCVLAMTHEEAVTDLARQMIQSYRQLPMMVYQVQTKFRDEARPRGGLVRLREFMMKDAYSFHADETDLNRYYDDVSAAYARFYNRCGIEVICVASDTGMMGGGGAHEFMFLSDHGEDTLLLCDHCAYAANREVYELHAKDEKKCMHCDHPVRTVRGIEVGNIFKLGTKYSEPMKALFTGADGALHPLIMGCYGIGISRTLACVIEANHDGQGIVWPSNIAPYAVHIVPIGNGQDVESATRRLREQLSHEDVLWDDRGLGVGRALHDADLLGMPLRVTISSRSLAAGGVELRDRKTGCTELVSEIEAVSRLRGWIDQRN